VGDVIEGSASRVAERRDVAKRPVNVARLPAKAAGGKARQAANAATAAPKARTGTDDEWAEF
jgi:hypothetical protein